MTVLLGLLLFVAHTTLGLVAGKGRTERRKSAKGRAHTPYLARYYAHRRAPRPAQDYEFELTLLRGKGAKALNLDTVAESFEWVDEQAALSGNVQLRRPDPADPASLPVARGHRIRCRVRWRGHSTWYTLWTMRCAAPQVQVDAGTVSVDLKDDLDLLSRSRLNWAFRATKRRRHGWFPHDITVAVAKRLGMKVGAIARTTHRTTLVKREWSGLDVIRQAYKSERSITARRYIIRIRNGELEVVNFSRNRVLYSFADQIRTALVAIEAHHANPLTVLTGHARIGSGKKVRKIRYTEHRAAVVRRYGYVHHVKDYGQVKSHAELRKLVKRDYASQLKVEHTATIQVPGIPFVRRGDGMELDMPTEGFAGARRFVFATRVLHQVEAGSYTTEMDVTTVDPIVQDAKRRAAELRAKSRSGRSTAVGTGEWVTIKATTFHSGADAGGAPSCGGSWDDYGYRSNPKRPAFAELGAAGANASMGGLLGPLFGYKGKLPCGFKIEARRPGGPSVIMEKADIGSGPTGSRDYKLDIWESAWPGLGGGIDENWSGTLEIRRAQ
jgi:hypothetical protein